jgi:hypothetical protein
MNPRSFQHQNRTQPIRHHLKFERPSGQLEYSVVIGGLRVQISPPNKRPLLNVTEVFLSFPIQMHGVQLRAVSAYEVYKSVHSCIAAKRPMTSPALQYSVLRQHSTARSIADDSVCCKATHDVSSSPVLSPVTTQHSAQ